MWRHLVDCNNRKHHSWIHNTRHILCWATRSVGIWGVAPRFINTVYFFICFQRYPQTFLLPFLCLFLPFSHSRPFPCSLSFVDTNSGNDCFPFDFAAAALAPRQSQMICSSNPLIPCTEFISQRGICQTWIDICVGNFDEFIKPQTCTRIALA